MQMLSYLMAIISGKVKPSIADVVLCQSYFEPLTIARNTILEEQGKVPQYLYFVFGIPFPTRLIHVTQSQINFTQKSPTFGVHTHVGRGTKRGR
jgi:hypothetical protein